MKFKNIFLFVFFIGLFSFGAYATTLLSVSEGITNPYNGSVWRGNITFNFTTNGPAMNVTFHFVTTAGSGSGTIPINITVFNDTAADTYWNLTVNSGAGTSGGTMVGSWVTESGTYNVTLTIQNFSYPGSVDEPSPELNKTLIGRSQGGGFTYRNTPPQVAPLNFTFNGSNTNNQNFTGGQIYVNVTVVEISNSQASCMAVGGVKWQITTSSGTVIDTQFLLSSQSLTTCNDIITYSGRKGLSYWNHTATLAGAPDDQYRMTIIANDTTACGGNGASGSVSYCGPAVNSTTFLSFAVDNTPPNVTSFVMNYSNGSNLSLSSVGKIEINVTANDSTTSVQFVKIGYTSSNGTELNLSATRNSTTWAVELPVNSLIDGLFRINYYVNDSLGNLNQSRNSPTGFLSFTLDRVAPFVGSMWMNATNASNFSASQFSSLVLNATVNDTTLGTQEVRFGFYNGNSTGVNVTATKSVAGVWSATVTSALMDGVYTVLLSANDTVNNVNNTISNLTFTLDRTAPNVTGFVMNFTNSSNFSANFVGKIEFNVTANDSTTSVQSVKIGFNNGNGTEFNLTAARNSSAWSVELPVSTIADGIYTVQYYVNDSLNNFNQSRNSSTGPLTFRLDRTAPNVTNITFGNYTNGIAIGPALANKTGNVLINLTAFINDTTLSVQNVLFNVTNNSGTVLGLSLSGSRVVEYWNASSVINVSNLAEGTYFINVIANDTVGNTNRTQNFTFIIDRSVPTATVSCSPSSVTVGDVVSCTCSGTDSFSSIVNNTFTGGSSTQSITTSSTGTATSSTCTVVDAAGNSATATGSWSANAAAASTGSSTGGGAGGSSAGVSTGVKDQFEKKVWTSINKGETATVELKNGLISISQLNFAVGKTVYGPWVQVQKVDKLPSEVKPLKTDVYTYVQITSNNVKDALSGMVDVKFKVPNTWIAEKKLTNEDVALLHFENKKWNQLNTLFSSNDGTYSWFSAQTPGFSYFAVGEALNTVTSPAVVSAPIKAGEPITSAHSSNEEVVSSEDEVSSEKVESSSKTRSSFLIWIMLGAIILIVLVFLLTRRKSTLIENRKSSLRINNRK